MFYWCATYPRFSGFGPCKCNNGRFFHFLGIFFGACLTEGLETYTDDHLFGTRVSMCGSGIRALRVYTDSHFCVWTAILPHPQPPYIQYVGSVDVTNIFYYLKLCRFQQSVQLQHTGRRRKWHPGIWS